MEQYRTTGFKLLPDVVKNLLIINILLFLATLAFSSAFHTDLTDILGMHYFGSHFFQPYQLVTYMFMHGGFGHIFFNMFALWMFGNALENFWGPKKFFIYYMVTGIGAVLVQMAINYFQISHLEASMTQEQISTVLNEGYKIIQENKNYVDPSMAQLNALYNTTTIGASGAVFGILLAFGMMFPNAELMLIFFPIPVKAKYMIPLYAALELFFGVANFSGDNIAHFAHLGGMLFGLVLMLYWKHQRKKSQFQ
jgi:membrane associated rhomboid family serine protease